MQHWVPEVYAACIAQYYKEMGQLGEKTAVLDVGSLDVAGNPRAVFPPEKYVYRGIDQQAGKNVDQVVNPNSWPFDDCLFDIVVSSSALEHCYEPWLVIEEMARVLRQDGLLMIVVPWREEIHSHPIDAWRILPDAMKYLLARSGRLKVLSVTKRGDFTVGIAQKWR